MAIADVGGQVGAKIDDHIASQYISHGTAVTSQAFADLSQQWNKLREQSDPNDTSIAKGFNEKIFQPWADKFLQNFESAPQRAHDWAQQTVESMRREFFHTITVDMGTRAADAVHQNLTTSAQADSLAAANNPSSLPFLYDKASANAQAQLEANPYLTASQRKQVHDELVPQHQKQIAQSALWGMGRANPEALRDQLESGALDKYVDGELKERALNFAHTQIRQKAEDDKRAYELEKQKKNDAANAALDEYITGLKNGDRRALANAFADPRLTGYAHLKENVNTFAHELTQQVIDRTDKTPHPQMVRDLIDGLHEKARSDPNNLSDQPIYDALKAKKLNTREFDDVMSHYRQLDKPMERNFNNQVQRAQQLIKSSIEGAMLFKADPENAVAVLNQIEKDAHDKLNKARNTGGDVNPLLDPQSKDYLFSPAVIRSYLQPPKADVAAEAAAIRAKETPRARAPLAPNQTPGGAATGRTKIPEFVSDEEAAKAGLKPGTRIRVNGVVGMWW